MHWRSNQWISDLYLVLKLWDQIVFHKLSNFSSKQNRQKRWCAYYSKTLYLWYSLKACRNINVPITTHRSEPRKGNYVCRSLLMHMLLHQIIHRDRGLYLEIDTHANSTNCILLSHFNSHVDWNTKQATVENISFLDFVKLPFPASRRAYLRWKYILIISLKIIS